MEGAFATVTRAFSISCPSCTKSRFLGEVGARRAQRAAGFGVGEPHHVERALAGFDIEADLGQERQAEAVGHHLNQRRQRRGAEGVDVVDAAQVAERQRLVAQAVAFLEKQQAILRHDVRRRAHPAVDLACRRQRQENGPRTGGSSRCRDARRAVQSAQVERAVEQLAPAAWSASRGCAARRRELSRITGSRRGSM